MTPSPPWPWKTFLETREEVLASWPTGEAVRRLEDAIAYQRTIPESRRFAVRMREAARQGELLLQPRAGVSLVDEHIRLLRYLETEGGADLLPTTIDSYTRQGRYDEASLGIARSVEAGTSLLNGFPAVNHGMAECRRVVEGVERPLQIRHGTPDARLLAEITLAAGFTAFEGGGISYNLPYTKRVPLERSLTDWQYVDRLVGYLEAEGVSINREPFGPLTGTLIPPCLVLTIGILEGLLALEQGARSLTLGYGQGGQMVQDIVAVRTLRELARETFARFGFEGAEVTVAFHQWMGGFPEDEAKAFGVIAWGAAVARLAGADKVIVKSPHEAMGVPSKEANAQGLRTTRQVCSMLADQGWADTPAAEVEADLLRREVRALLDAVFALGGGDTKAGVVAAFRTGVLDIPFAPSLHNLGRVLPARDDEGFIRFLHRGELPLPRDVRDYHRERLAARARAEGREVCFQMVTDDIYAVSKGRLVGRPR